MTFETRIKRQIKDYVESIGGYWAMIAGGAYSKTGDPDMVVCVNGVFYAVEAKTPNGTQSEWQKKRQREIENAGGVYILARSVGDVEKIIQNKKEVQKQ